MNGFAFFVGSILPYLAVLVFVAGMGYRFYVWFKTPQPGKMALFGVGKGPTFRDVMAETLFFPSLFRGDKALWALSWFFHVTLALVFLGHVRVSTGLIDQALLSMGMSQASINTMSSVVGSAAGIVLIATGLFLLIRRMAVKRVREVSGIPDFFALLLVIGIIGTGNVMRFGAHFDLEQTRAWAASLLTFSPVVPMNAAFLIHAMLAFFLVMYIPFSKILHFGGIFFTQALVKRR